MRGSREKSVERKLMDLLARRSHSEAELSDKLSQEFDAQEVQEAIARAREKGWITPPAEMSAAVAQELRRKNKGHEFISRYLEEKGLPPITEDFELEVTSARDLLQTKLKHDFTERGALPEALLAKAQRLLANRGYSEETIARVLAQ